MALEINLGQDPHRRQQLVMTAQLQLPALEALFESLPKKTDPDE